jgi:DNA invertase Pin-like site-specific DNA recombinase
LYFPARLCHLLPRQKKAAAEIVKGEPDQMKRAVLYCRVSTSDQHIEAQLYDLRELAAQKGYEVVQEYQDCGISGTKARGPGLDALMADARRKKFSVVLVAAFDRIARSTRNCLQIIDELDSLGIEFISRREGVATGDGMGRLFVTIVSAISELERSLIVERVKSGMRRARLKAKLSGVHGSTWIGSRLLKIAARDCP